MGGWGRVSLLAGALWISAACARAVPPPPAPSPDEVVPRHWDQVCDATRPHSAGLVVSELFDTVGRASVLGGVVQPRPLTPPWPLYDLIGRYDARGAAVASGTWDATVDSAVASSLEDELRSRIRALPGLLEPTGFRAQAVFGRRTAFDLVAAGTRGPRALEVTMVGNAGVALSDGITSLLVDLPYESGAFGYMTYDPSGLNPQGEVVSVITHDHRDHFDEALLARRAEWRVLGSRGVLSRFPFERWVWGDSVRVGAFDVITIATPHTDDHRSYRIRWGGNVFHFTGDTEAPRHLLESPPIDVLFITPWLSCAAVRDGLMDVARRSVAYHLRPDGADTVCGDVQVLEQGSTLRVGLRQGATGRASSPTVGPP